MSGRPLLLGLFLAGALGCGRGNLSPPSAGPRAPADPVRRLQGEWVAVQGESQGSQSEGPEHKAFLSQYRMIFDGGSFTAVSPDSTTKGTFQVDASARPLAMKMRKEDGDEVAAIFEFRDGRLFFCATKPGDPPPNEFKTAPGSSALFTVYEKVR